MKAATTPQRLHDARLLVIDAQGRLQHASRRELARLLEPGDLLVANDAATLPASLAGVHERSGAVIEVRLAGRRSLAVDDVREFTAIVFGAGDPRTRTEDRVPPPALEPGDRLVLGRVDSTRSPFGRHPAERGAVRLGSGPALGPLRATVLRLLDHPRLVSLRFDGTPDAVWAGIARHGRPIQYAHVPQALALWDLWTRVAALPVAFEPPSAGFVLDWGLLGALKARGVGFATLTHAAGISSTGDAALDARLPFDEPYHLPASTVAAIAHTRAHGARVVALGTTVVRALEHAASLHGPALQPGVGLATQRIGPATRLQVVGAIVSGTHEPGTSHYEMLRAFAGDALLQRTSAELERNGYLTHEFGDSVLMHAQGLPSHRRHIEATAPP
jgi:S-adenosylmethionine:tRNA ribosyltransferase-isomerase